MLSDRQRSVHNAFCTSYAHLPVQCTDNSVLVTTRTCPSVSTTHCRVCSNNPNAGKITCGNTTQYQQYPVPANQTHPQQLPFPTTVRNNSTTVLLLPAAGSSQGCTDVLPAPTPQAWLLQLQPAPCTPACDASSAPADKPGHSSAPCGTQHRCSPCPTPAATP